mgnify:CR=1 FL=1
MATYQSILAYDGTEFAGFQRQRRRRTVQGEVEKALRRLGWRERRLIAKQDRKLRGLERMLSQRAETEAFVGTENWSQPGSYGGNAGF